MSVTARQTMRLNLIPGGIMPVLHVNQIDSGWIVDFEIYRGCNAWTIPSDASVTIRGTKRDGYGITGACTFSGNVVTAEITEQMTACAGPNIFELRFADNNGKRLGTINFVVMVERAALDGNTVISDSEIAYAAQVLDQLQSVEAYKTELDQKVFYEDTVADMVADTALFAGCYVRTGGYYAVNDGGAALYRIDSAAPSAYYETLSNGLCAELIYDETVSPEQFGAYGDGTHDDAQSIQTAINNADGKIVIFKKIYKISQSLVLPSGSHLEGAKGTKVYNFAECIFSGNIRNVFISHIAFENQYAQYENGVRLGRVFDTIALSNISKNTFVNFYSVFEAIRECTSFDGNVCSYLGQRLGLGATDSFISQNYINASQVDSGKTIMLRYLNNSSFNNNFVDYFNTCFRFQAGNRSSQITGNTFDDCMAVFRDFMEGVTVTGNTFTNIKYVAANWNTQPSADLINKPWGVIIYDWSTTKMDGSEDTKQLRDTVFSGNLFRNCDYYIWIDGSIGSRAVYLYGRCQFRGNPVTDVQVFAGFLVTRNMLNAGAMDDVYFDFWHGRTYASLPRPALTESSGAANSRVESYQHMKCFVNGEEYINMDGTWKKYTFV